MNIKNLNLIKLQIGVIFFSFGPLISKFASRFSFTDIKFIFSYFFLLVLLFSYFLIWKSSLKLLNLSIAYSYRSTSIIWSLIWSYIFFGEEITSNNIIGSILILIGIRLITID